MSDYLINLHEAIYSLSDALDLVGVTHIHHGKRVAYMAAECGKHLCWNKTQLDELFQAAILHDSGVSKTAVHAKLAQLQWEEESEHCHLGAALMSSSPMLQRFAPIVRHHHTHWHELKSMDLPLEVKLNANCIYMVDRVDILTLKYLVNDTDILLGKESIRQTIADRRDEWFCPELVDAFMEISYSEAFWFSLEANNINGYVSTWLSETHAQRMSFEELRSLVSVFSRIVDAKSAFTREHSDGVANLSRHLGELFGLAETNCEMLELAGLLHDIGKLRIPDELLEKPGRLTEAEIGLMRRHSFDTYNILKNITGLEQVSLWAAHHHERVDGSGYPYHLDKDGLSLEARIIEVADVFQALAQRRPYREPLPPEQILVILKEQVAKGKLDADVVGKVDLDLHACWQAAIRKGEVQMAPVLQGVSAD
ncbi:HD domain-containing phosphohydrolase [Sideroxydans lithotrophicus]|uniref:Metal dependent phosphohydrolase n=1 Tax=Sideroxydans lithotrophicus (strain ES-1) TaxID=580332 RepID=D5CLQ3_SIDLE|nr:HD domain-containing phosphohydrolase [Sideroxydans lithotrophicus]ADE12498.1 metal dependent phosphohydrolase [Sideroxydans lithotrophicus ES-1]